MKENDLSIGYLYRLIDAADGRIFFKDINRRKRVELWRVKEATLMYIGTSAANLHGKKYYFLAGDKVVEAWVPKVFSISKIIKEICKN